MGDHSAPASMAQQREVAAMSFLRNRPEGRTKFGLAVAALITTLIAVIGFPLFLFVMHTTTWDYWPNAIPTLAHFGYKDYHCDRSQAVPTAPTPGLHHYQNTFFGGEIWAASRGFNGSIIIKSGGSMVDCEVEGGP
jgi:hypothetical protein